MAKIAAVDALATGRTDDESAAVVGANRTKRGLFTSGPVTVIQT